MSQISDYLNLLTAQYDEQPNFLSVLMAILQPYVDEINIIQTMPALHDLETAGGAQLDTVGRWVGISRTLRLPIDDVYFSFDTAGLGFDEGVWFSSENPSEGVIVLDDGNYRLMIKAKIAANIWDGSLGHANLLLQEVFGTADVLLEDHFNMTQEFILSGSPPSELFAQLVAQGYIQLKPATVNLV